tara:strand:- start:2371 stop:3348 length:978 start_codon:yes stop_codon:yes gene_type:complete
MSNKKKIIICYTPFHLFCVKLFINKLSNTKKENYLLYIGPLNNQAEYYLNILSNHVQLQTIRTNANKFINCINILLLMIRIPKKKYFNEVFCANYKVVYSRIILFFIPKANFYKFDDGVGEILEYSWFQRPENIFLKLLLKITKPKLSYENLKNLPRAFTIYKQLKNEDTVLLEFPKLNFETSSEKNKKIILLGQDYSRNTDLMDISEEEWLYKHTIDKFKVDEFIPHPLSMLNNKGLATKVLYPDQIAEEYIYSQLNSHNCYVIGFRTSAVYNCKIFFDEHIATGRLTLINLTVCRDNLPISKTWIDDMWASNFSNLNVNLRKK